MGSPCSIKIAGSYQHAKSVSDACISEARRFESVYSRYTNDSIVAQINTAAGLKPVRIDAECRAILNYAGVCFNLSGGLFDVTAGVLRRIWSRARTRKPTEEELAPILSLIDFNQVEITDDTVFLPRSGMEIDLGGVVKEYAADALAQLMKNHGVDSAVVNLGGDIFCVGARSAEEGWQIGIVDPKGGGAAAAVQLVNSGLATSGGYERFLEIEGQQYSHILDPRTGFPVNSLASVSVIAEQTVVAGSAATIALLKGEKEGLKWLEDFGCPYLAIDQGGQMVSGVGFNSGARGSEYVGEPLKGPLNEQRTGFFDVKVSQ